MTFGEYRSDRENEKEREKGEEYLSMLFGFGRFDSPRWYIERVRGVFARALPLTRFGSRDVFLIGNFRRQ